MDERAGRLLRLVEDLEEGQLVAARCGRAEPLRELRLDVVGRAQEVDLLGRYQECFDTAMRAFIAGLENDTPFETDRLDNLETLELMESVYRAAGVEVAA